MVFNQLQNYQEALNAFSSALEIDPDNPEILAEMAEDLSTIGNYQDATPFYERVLELQPNNFPLAGKLGRNYINLKSYKKAYDVFALIYSNDSSNIYWNKQLAYSASQIGMKKQAIYFYERVQCQ